MSRPKRNNKLLMLNLLGYAVRLWLRGHATLEAGTDLDSLILRRGSERFELWQADTRMMNAHGLDVAAWKTVFAFPPLMDSVPKPIIVAARAAVDGGKLARRLVSQKSRQESDTNDDSESDWECEQ